MDDAVDRLTVGPRRVGIELGHQGQCRRAITEVGTALTSHLLRQYENAEVERCDRISINPRGQVCFFSSCFIFERHLLHLTLFYSLLSTSSFAPHSLLLPPFQI